MSARVLAQESSNWYLSHLDTGVSNANNVKRCLRRPVLALTQKILASDDLTPPLCGLEIETLAPNTSPTASEEKKSGEKGTEEISQNCSGDWREYLLRASTSADEDTGVWNKNDQEVYESLGRRTRARMDAFLEGCALALPDDPLNAATRNSNILKAKPRLPSRPTSSSSGNLSLTEALSGYDVASKSKSGSGTSTPTSGERPTSVLRQLSNVSSGSGLTYPQLREADLSTRLELYIRCLSRVHSTKKECVVAMEPPRAVRARVNAIVVDFVNTVGCVRSLSPVLTNLLQSATKELLAVDTLGGDVCSVIRYVVSEYEKKTSFASLAFLSSPEDSAEKILTPLLLSYVQYLQLNWENLVAECDLERMLSTVLDTRMRHLFKNIEFQSIGHLLETCQGFRSELQHIELPPNMGGLEGEDVNSRCTDPEAIRQAVRDLQRETITVNGHILPPARNRKELVSLLSETLNSRTIMHEKRRKPKSRPKTVRRTESCPSKMSSLKVSKEDNDDFISSGNEGDTDGSTHSRRDFPAEAVSNGKRRTRRRNFHLQTVDMVTRRLLIAGSRTGMGGDAFFIVRDLFGDEDVEVVPSKSLGGYGRATKGGTIEIIVRLASVTIKCHGSFDVYPKPVDKFREPLIQVHTTTSETIYLHEVRSEDSKVEDITSSQVDGSSDDNSGSYPTKPVLVLQEKKTDKTGWRTLSIRPALYEVVEVFNTPS